MRKSALSLAAAWTLTAGLATAAAQESSLENGHPGRDRQLTPGSWRSLGPVGIPGPALTIAAHPTAAGEVSVGLRGSGVWRTKDDGLSWRPTSDLPCNSPVSIVLDPHDPQRLWVALDEREPRRGGVTPCGLVRSTDGGRSWRASTSPPHGSIIDVVLEPLSGTLVAATATDLWRSADGGETFNICRHQSRWVSLAVVPDAAVLLAAGTGEAAGVFRSTDLGLTWLHMTSGVEDPSQVGSSRLAVGSESPQVVYWAAGNTASTPRFLGLWRSDDHGSSFDLVYDPAGDHPWDPHSLREGGTVWACAVNPSDPDHLLLGMMYLFESIDGGRSFVSTGLSANGVSWSAASPESIWLVTTHGTLHSRDGGQSFADSDRGLNATEVLNLARSSSAPASLLATTSFQIVVTDAPPTWHIADTYPWRDVAIDPSDPFTMYLAAGGVRRSTDQGRTWSNLASILSYAVESSLYIDATDRTTLWYASSGKIAKVSAVDGSVDIRPLPQSFGAAPEIDQSRSEPGTVAVLTDRGVLVTTSWGVTWMARSEGILHLDYFATDLAIDPVDSRRIVVTTDASRSDIAPVYLTDNLGGGWRAAGAGLPAEAVYSVVCEVEPPYRYFAGTRSGVYFSRDRGETWSPLVPRLPRVAVLDLLISEGSGTLTAATGGRGVWEIDLAALPATD